MDIYGAKFQEQCLNISRDIVYSVFTTFLVAVLWHHHWYNLHNRKTLISLKQKKIFQKEKRHSSVFWKAFQISRKIFLCHIYNNTWSRGDMEFIFECSHRYRTSERSERVRYRMSTREDKFHISKRPCIILFII